MKVLAFSLGKTTIFALSASVKENQLQVSARKSGGQKPLLDHHSKKWGSIDPLDPVLPRSMCTCDDAWRARAPIMGVWGKGAKPWSEGQGTLPPAAENIFTARRVTQ